MTRVYLDVCCLNRPFDNQTQDRVRLESVAVLTVLKRIEYGEMLSIGSTAIQAEINKNQDQEHKARLQQLSDCAGESILVGQEQVQRANDLRKLGFHFFDALHLACAEAADADILLTTDDRFLKLARRVNAQLKVRVANPADWLMEIIDNDGRNDV